MKLEQNNLRKQSKSPYFYLKLSLPKIQLSVRNLTNKLGNIHTTEYYAATETNGSDLWTVREMS